MDRRAFADKMLDIAENRASEIAERWYRSMSANARVPTYCSIPKQELIAKAISFYQNLKHLYFAENPYQAVLQSLEKTRYVEEAYANGIPLPEVIYGLIMMRRHIWLYADIQALYNTPLDMYQAVQSINRTLLLFDYAMHIVTQKYQDM
jgi:hypothetical protein